MLDALSAALKGILYAGILLAAGSVFAQVQLQLKESFAHVALRSVQIGATLVFVACVAGTLVMMVRLGGQFDSPTLTIIFSSSVGAALFMQVSAVALMLAAGSDPSAYIMRVIGSGLLILSLAFNGHAITVGFFESLVLAGHAALAAWWVGSLIYLRHSCQTQNVDATAPLLARFGAAATVAVGLLIVAGSHLIWTMVPFDQYPTFTGYEQRLAIKVALAATVFGVAAYNKWRLTPKILAGDLTAITTLRRTIGVELIAIGLVLAATAVLTTYSSPHE
jgi:putative copper export protein